MRYERLQPRPKYRSKGKGFVTQPTIRVSAAVIRRGSTYLLTQRAEGSHAAGYWEFPGGKIEPGESPGQALVRELREELDIGVRVGTVFRVLTHSYPDRTVELHFLHAEIENGEPRAVEVGDWGWYAAEEMEALPLLPADLELIPELSQLARETV